MKKIISLILVVIAIFIASWFYVNVKAENNNENPFGNRDFAVESGQGINLIADNLIADGFITSKFDFKAYLLFSGLKSKLLPGEYHLHTQMSIKEIVKEFVKTERTRAQVQITLLEGWNMEEVGEYLESKGLFSKKDFLEYVAMKNFNYDFLKDNPRSASLEGFLYPDTYFVYEDSTPEDVILRLLNNFDQKLTDELKREIEKQNLDIFETVTLASIVEKEVFGYEDRLIVANIFTKRLDIGMSLQADSTVNFITKSGRASSTYKDLEVDDPYNTYKYPGLPPGPIANPSIEAIKSVVYATENPYWFFLTDLQGNVYYAKTHDDHVNNKFKYLK